MLGHYIYSKNSFPACQISSHDIKHCIWISGTDKTDHRTCEYYRFNYVVRAQDGQKYMFTHDIERQFHFMFMKYLQAQ